MRDEFGAKNPKSQMLRFHTQTAGVQLTAQQPEVNLVRVAIQGLAAVLGGTQSLHTNSFDEALALPSEKAARLALRTQQVIAYETDVTKTVDPFAGSYAVEALTDDVEAEARKLMDAGRGAGRRRRRDRAGLPEERDREGGLPDRPRHRRRRADRRRGQPLPASTRRTRSRALRVDPAIEEQQAERLAKLRAERDQAEVDKHLAGADRGRAQGERQRALPDEGGAAGEGHRRRGLQRAARGLGRVRPAGRVLSGRVSRRPGSGNLCLSCRSPSLAPRRRRGRRAARVAGRAPP